MSHERSTAHELLDDLEVIEQLLNDKVSSLKDIPEDNIPVLEDVAEEVTEDVPKTIQAVIHPLVNTPLVVLPGVKATHVTEAKQSAPSTPKPPQFMLADSLEEQLKLEGEKMIQGVIDDWLPKLESRLRQHLNEVLDQYVGERVASWNDTSKSHIK